MKKNNLKQYLLFTLLKVKKTGKVIFLMLSAAVLLCFAGCKKDQGPVASAARTIRFLLYTTANHSANNNIIKFKLSIRTARETLFDSALAPMRIKYIPGPANKMVFEKTIPGYDASDLATEFRFNIENVGDSWYTDTCSAGEMFKVVDFDFR